MFSHSAGCEALYDSIGNLSSIGKDEHIDPSKKHTLPFLSIYWTQNDRFKVKKEGYVLYLGREKFLEIEERIEENFKVPSYTERIYVYATIGYGKSHILAAVACYLMSRRDCLVHAVYIPDPALLAENFVAYMQSAFMSVCAHESTRCYWRTIFKMSCAEGDIRFALNTPLYFVYIVDANKSKTKEAKTATSIHELTGSSYRYLVSYLASANSRSYARIQDSSRGDGRIIMFGGMAQASVTLLSPKMISYPIYRLNGFIVDYLGD
jgi:hypothetical protein